jgi:hypothetical protein
MSKMSVLMAAAAIGLATGAQAQPAQQSRPITVNDFTSAEATRALKAATDAGYQSPVIRAAQDGNFFMIAAKDGGLKQLTVTPKGEVFASNSGPYVLPLTAVTPADKAQPGAL